MYTPDRNILKDLVDSAERNKYPPMAYVLGIERVLRYVLQFDEFIMSDNNAAHVFRHVGKHVEFLITQFISQGSIDEDKGFAVGEVVGDVLTMTSHVEEFDVDFHYTRLADILTIIPTAN